MHTFQCDADRCHQDLSRAVRRDKAAPASWEGHPLSGVRALHPYSVIQLLLPCERKPTVNECLGHGVRSLWLMGKSTGRLPKHICHNAT